MTGEIHNSAGKSNKRKTKENKYYTADKHRKDLLRESHIKNNSNFVVNKTRKSQLTSLSAILPVYLTSKEMNTLIACFIVKNPL